MPDKKQTKRAPAMRLADVEMPKQMKRKDYDKALKKWQKVLRAVQVAYRRDRRDGVVLFEGWDAAGKGGAIRRMAWVLDPRGFSVYPIAAPSPEERGRHYLRRFWVRLPGPGGISVFDRSWYGRVLVERVDDFIEESEWRRSYDEINEFERLLTDDGTRVVKLFLHITPEEQLARFAERLSDPWKRWKLTTDDMRNRAKWDAYTGAIEEMFERTSTPSAPWHVVPANDKLRARVECIKLVVRGLSEGVDLSPPLPDPTVTELATSILGLKIEHDMPVRRPSESPHSMT